MIRFRPCIELAAAGALLLGLAGCGRGEQAHQAVLKSVDVLVLVDRDPAPALPVGGREVRPLPQESERAQEKIVEVEEAPLCQSLLVGGETPLQLREHRYGGVDPAPAAQRRDLFEEAVQGRARDELAGDLRALRGGRDAEAFGEPGGLGLLAQQQ